jgi:hypothetical protein
MKLFLLGVAVGLSPVVVFVIWAAIAIGREGPYTQQFVARDEQEHVR